MMICESCGCTFCGGECQSLTEAGKFSYILGNVFSRHKNHVPYDKITDFGMCRHCKKDKEKPEYVKQFEKENPDFFVQFWEVIGGAYFRIADREGTYSKNYYCERISEDEFSRIEKSYGEENGSEQESPSSHS